jgi:glutaryl-CoA dehydrogenase (non-decarboxylating)
MKLELIPQQQQARAAFREFVDAEIVPLADQIDQQEVTPPELIKKVAAQGYLSAALPSEYGGGMDMITYGLLNEEVGRGCSSIRSLMTVHNMVAQSLLKWGSEAQKARWLSALASGSLIGAFGLTEPNVGSNAGGVETTAELDNDHYRLNGKKIWITYGQIADLYLIFARCKGQPTAFLVERDSPGFSVTPINGMLGTRGSMLAELTLTDCRIPAQNLLGAIGFGVAYVATSALDYGRYTVAWGCIGIAQACLEACLKHTSERKQFDQYLKDYQLIQHMITDMITHVKAARLLCLQAGYLKDIGDPTALVETALAKYFASTTATKTALDAVQIHGALGCSSRSPVQRYLRDAKIMEIIEGSSQIQQMMIARQAYRF